MIRIGSNADGRLEVIYVGTNDALYHNWQTSPNNGWAGEAPFGGKAKQVAIGQNADGRLEVIYVGTNDALYHNWQTSPNGGWAGEDPFGGKAKQVAIGSNADGRLEVIYVGTNDAIYHNWQTSPNNGWAGEAPLGGKGNLTLHAFYVICGGDHIIGLRERSATLSWRCEDGSSGNEIPCKKSDSAINFDKWTKVLTGHRGNGLLGKQVLLGENKYELKTSVFSSDGNIPINHKTEGKFLPGEHHIDTGNTCWLSYYTWDNSRGVYDPNKAESELSE